MPALDIRDIVSIVTALLMAAGVVWGVRVSVAKLEGSVAKLDSNQLETLRQVEAIHKRLDDYGRRLTRVELEHAVLEAVVNERVPNMNIRASQRFKLQSSEPPSLAEDKGAP